MGLANLRTGAPNPYTETYCHKRSLQALLEGADRQHAAKRQRLSPSQSLNHGVYYTIHVPPTPLRPGSGLGQVHSQEVKYRHRSSVSSTGSAPMYYPRPPTASSFQPPTPVTTPQMPQQQVHHQHPQSIPRSRSLISRNHDRYICRACHKAFSRPSSLRIHSYSHTGEKPFRCTHAGCAKAFSVRSNMKRHERRNHYGRPVAPIPAAAPTAPVS
ncbi:hypothetical protein N7513_003458 [Penicillium frequentans]|nr:hypothetical protein N7513_003458 [Penicillium glabrum]